MTASNHRRYRKHTDNAAVVQVTGLSALQLLGSTSVALLIGLSTPAVAHADWLNLLELRSEYLRPTDLEGGQPAGNAPWSNADDVQVSTYSVRANLPLPLGDSTLLVAGLGYRRDSLSFWHESPDERGLDLHAFELPITAVHMLSNKWTLLLDFTPALASDRVSLNSKALRASGLAVASYKFSDTLVLGGGAAASLDFGSLLPIPVMHVDWKPHPRVSIDGLLPAQIDAKVRLGDRFEVGIHGDIEGNSYFIDGSRIRDSWPCSPEANDPATTDDETRADASRCVQQLAYSTATGGAVVSTRLFGSVWLSIYTGYTVTRRFEESNGDGDRVEGGNQTLPNDFFARAGLTWRLPE